MRICISGASGFIGSKLTQYHLSLGHDVRYLTRSADNQIPDAQAFIGDLSGPIEPLVSFLEGADIFYHCAGEINNEALMRKTHVIGTQQLLQAVKEIPKQQHPPHWIQLSSCGAYGQPSKRPITNRFVDEETNEEPNGEYETTKTESDHLVMNYAKAHNAFYYTVIRPSIVFGAGMRSTAIKRLTNIIKKGVFFYVRDKAAIANYVHVDDVVSAMTLSANNKLAFNQTFIVANDCGYKEVVDTIADVLRVKKPNIVINEYWLRKILSIIGLLCCPSITQEHIDVMVRRTEYSNHKLKALLGWVPSAAILNQITQHIEKEMVSSSE